MTKYLPTKKRVIVLLAEAVAIALGVFLSLWADEWRANRHVAAESREALERLQLDLVTDSEQITRLADLNKRSIDAIRTVLALDPESEDTPAEMAQLIPYTLESWVLQDTGQEYDALRNSGRLGLIKNPKLLTALGQYYKQQGYATVLFAGDLEQARVVAKLLYPHIEFPRDVFTRERRPVAPTTSEASYIPVPTATPAVAGLIGDRVFVNEMTQLGLYKQLLVNALKEINAGRNTILELITAELDR